MSLTKKISPFAPVTSQPTFYMVFNVVLYMLHYNVVFQGKQILGVVKDSDCSKQSKQTLCLHTCAASAQRCLLSPAAVGADRH